MESKHVKLSNYLKNKNLDLNQIAEEVLDQIMNAWNDGYGQGAKDKFVELNTRTSNYMDLDISHSSPVQGDGSGRGEQ